MALFWSRLLTFYTRRQNGLHVTDKAATAGNFATTAAWSLSSSNFTSARRHRRLPSSDLKQAIHCDLNVPILAGSHSYLCSRIALPVRSPSPRKRLYLKFPTIKTAAAPHTGGPSSLQERGRDSCLGAVLWHKQIFTSLKACMGCTRFFLKERKNVMFLNKIDLRYCLVVFFVVVPLLRALSSGTPK